MSKLADIFSALRHRNFRYFWFGQCISLIGTWMQRTAQTWLVYQITDSPLLVGLLGVFQYGPVLLLSLFAGVIADRFPKRRLLLISQTIFMVQAFILTVLVWTGYVKYWHVLVLALVFGAAQTLDMPSRQAFFIELVGREDLMNAISLNSTIVNLARIFGPMAAGAAMIVLGPSLCFLINALSFIAVIIGLLMINVGNTASVQKTGDMLQNIKEGLAYIVRNRALISTVTVICTTGIFAMNTDVIIPVFTKEVLGRGAVEYTWLLAAIGVGSFFGAVFMAVRSRRGLNSLLLYGSALVLGALEVAASFARNLTLSMLVAVFMGFAIMSFLNMANSTLQLNSSDEYRGRVMSIYSMAFIGSTPAGNFFVGYVMENKGAGMGYFLGGALTLVLTLLLLAAGYWRKKQRSEE
jgi:predicted MFS family arabinose efflux permease